MPHIEWTPDLEVDIPVIDGQHRRIVDYINEIHALERGDRSTLGRIVEDLVDYTLSHFAFEETLMEEAGYPAVQVHRQTHAAFRRRIEQLRDRFRAGEDVSEALASLLETWLIGHILHDDSSYAPVVRQQMERLRRRQNGRWLGRLARRVFGRDPRRG